MKILEHNLVLVKQVQIGHTHWVDLAYLLQLYKIIITGDSGQKYIIIITYGNSSTNVTQLNLIENHHANGHGSNTASVDLAVQSHDGKTPTIRATFGGDYWNSNVLTVTFIGSGVASTGNIRQLSTFDSKLTGQDPSWK